jgi:hypothetical protein
VPYKCELCERDVPSITRHHLFPKSRARRKGKPIDEIPLADLCSACHRQIHHLFDNRQLADTLDTVEALRRQPEIQTFLRWVRKQPAERRIRVR